MSVNGDMHDKCSEYINNKESGNNHIYYELNSGESNFVDVSIIVCRKWEGVSKIVERFEWK